MLKLGGERLPEPGMNAIFRSFDPPRKALLTGLLVSAASIASVVSTGCADSDDPNASTASGPMLQPGVACVGVDPDKAKSPGPSSRQALSADCKPGTCLGQPAPEWKAFDHNPLSCGFSKEYGIQAFIGQPVLVANLAGWCQYCQAQAAKLERMRLELDYNGLKAHIIIINSSSADNDTDRKHLTQRCSLPLFQDTTARKVWDKNGGNKDDFYFYDRHGVLRGYFPHGGEHKTNLSVQVDYDAMRQRLFDLAKAP